MTTCKFRLSALCFLIGGLALLLGGCVGGGLPVINVLTVPTTVVEGSTVTITVQATGGGGGPIIYSWTATCGGTFVPNPSDPIPSGQTHTVQWTAPAVTADTPCTVRVTATSRGRSSTASRSTTVLRIPSVVSTVPAAGATAVPVTVDIVVTFDGPMNPATVVLTCLDEEGPEGCNMTISAPVWNPDNSVATYTVGDPDAPLPENLEFLETYFMRVTGSSSMGVPMAAPHEWSFTTRSATAPSITSMTVPSPVTEGTTGHTVSVVATGDSPLSYNWSASGPGICSAITFSPNNSPAASTSTMTVPTIPSAPLPRADLGCTVSVTVSGPGGSTSDGRPSTVRRIPFVVSTVPANLQTGVTVTTEVRVTFDGSMTPASLSLLCTNEGPASFPVTEVPCNMTFGTPSWSDAYGTAPNSRVDITVGDPDAAPPTNLQYERGYRLQVNATSASGVAMAAAHSWEFATEATPLGRIVIVKTAVGGDATFDYTTSGTGGLPPTFQITTSGGSGSQTFDNITPGTHTVTESAPPAGWDFTSLSCVDPDGGTTVDLITRTANIDLDIGEIVTCTYTNTKRGTIVINKTAVGGDATFGYTTSGTGDLPPTFQITTVGGTGSQTFANIVPGAHTVTEDTPPANWSLTGLSCTDPDGGTTVNLGARTANIDLDPGETVTCTYTNTYTPPILPQCPVNLISEVEPNNTNATAQALDLAPGQGTAIVSGGITPIGDLDYFQITVTEPSLVFAYIRTNIATTSNDSTMMIGLSPTPTGSSCTGTGFAECDDDDGGQIGVSSSIAGLSLSPGTYNILVKHFSGAAGTATITPYRLYVAVVPTTAVISEVEGNDTPATGQVINTCPAVISGTGGGTGASDYYRFLVPGGNTVLWASAQQPVAGQWNSRLELWRVSTNVKIPFTGAAGIPNCDSAGTGTATDPASESCSMDYNYDSADRWIATPEDYAVNIRRNADPDTGTGGTYNLLIVVMTDVGPVPPPTPPNLPAVFAYVKRGATGNDTVMRLRTTTSGVPAYSSCAAATPPDIECDDDAGVGYTSPTAVVYPPTGGGGGLNSAIAGHPFANIGELIFIQGYGSTTVIGAFDLYIHVPDGSLGQLTEAEGNGTIATANPVPALPACTAVYSEATGNQRPGFGAGGSDNVPVPLPSPGWTMEGSFGSDTDVDYFGPITIGATERVFIAIDGSLDFGGSPHDHNGYNADISLSLRTSGDVVIITIDDTAVDGARAEVFSGTPGAHTGGLPGGVFYIRVAAKTGDAFKGYRLTACKFGP